MFSQFFIERPIFASVISVVIILAGIVSVAGLPVSQYPEITPPTIEVSATYPGANAQVISETVAAPIEQQVNGVEDMIYMSSTSASDGSYKLTVTFEVGTNLDIAQVLVQNRVKLAEPNLPEDVKRQGVNTKKKSTNIIMFISLFSPKGRYDELFLANYATLRLRDELSRVAGVGEVFVGFVERRQHVRADTADRPRAGGLVKRRCVAIAVLKTSYRQMLPRQIKNLNTIRCRPYSMKHQQKNLQKKNITILSILRCPKRRTNHTRVCYRPDNYCSIILD